MEEKKNHLMFSKDRLFSRTILWRSFWNAFLHCILLFAILRTKNYCSLFSVFLLGVSPNWWKLPRVKVFKLSYYLQIRTQNFSNLNSQFFFFFKKNNNNYPTFRGPSTSILKSFFCFRFIFRIRVLDSLQFYTWALLY
jgi:hypothetical protein